MLARSASGENDLDLLVSRAEVQRFTEILFRLGFKEARLSADKQLPGVLDYYGYDSEADRWVHVHAHYQLILGDDMTKNYRLPIERPYLESAIQESRLVGFKIPAPEFEFVVFVMRMILKHSTWDAMFSFQGALSISEKKELAYLTTLANPIYVQALLKQHLPFVNVALFDNCVQSLQPDCPIWFRIKVGQQLQNRLKAHARRPQISDIWLKLWRRGSRGIRKYIFKYSPRKRLASGGAIIAVVGGDGAGKSTAVDEIYAWLSKNFLATKIHLGKPPRSLSAFAIKGILKVGRLLGFFSNKKAANAKPPELSWLLWHVLTARDRYRAYLKARRFATNGGVVICDRYPLPQIKLMDGRRASQFGNTGQTNRLIRFLVKLENKFYQNLMSPDLLIVLKVDPEIAVQRKLDEDTNLVRMKCREIWELDWQQTSAHVIDAGQSRAEVLSEIKSLIWSKL